MSTIVEILQKAGYAVKSKEGRFGIEIETETMSSGDYPKGFLTLNGTDPEGHTLYVVPLKYWTAVTDGSLRHFGIEYIFKNPLDHKKTHEALDEFGALTIPFLQDQPSCSVHVHMNFGNETPLVLANFITTWILIENLLLEFSGPVRRSSVFSAPVRIAEGQLETVTKLFRLLEQGSATGMILQQNHVKYASLNLGNLWKLQSLEARCFRGTTDVEAIKQWIDILNRLVDFSKTPGLTPRHVLKAYINSPSEFLWDIFGPMMDLLKCDDYLPMMERNERYAYEIVSCVQNWETFGMKFDEPKATVKSRKKTAPATAYDELYAMVQPASWAQGLTQFADTVASPVLIDELEEGPF